MPDARLPFLLPDFTRIIWHSAAAQRVWAPRISNVTALWGEVEKYAVVTGMRPSCLTFFDPHSFPEACQDAARYGLTLIPLQISGITSQYSATSAPLVPGQKWQYRSVLTRPENARAWVEAWRASDNLRIGELLGYPACCREFFERVWVADAKVDTTWDMAVRTLGVTHREWERGVELRIPPTSTPWQGNILLRWLGVRLVPHLPCAFDCAATEDQANAYWDVAEGMKAPAEELAWLREMLEWPVEWSALHGIAEVRTPVLTISTRTVATADNRVVQRAGTRYPDEGASGLRFPFRIVQGKVTEKPAYRRAQVPVWELNGFGSEESMVAAHDALLACLPDTPGSFLDLGCGTGRLLERAEERGWSVVGLEVDPTRAGAARVPVRRGSLFDTTLWAHDHDVIAFMPGRLLEPNVSEVEKTAVRAALRERAGAVLLYAYGDWLARFGGLGPLIAEAGLGSGEWEKQVQHPNVAAALVRFTADHAGGAHHGESTT